MIRYKKIALILFATFLLCLSACKFGILDSNDNDVIDNDTNDDVKEIDYSIGITNVSNSNVSESFPIHQPVINHKITTDKSIFAYDEELIINVELAASESTSRYIIEGDLNFRIKESEYYEVIGKSEYVIEEFSYENYRSRKDNLYPLKFKFIIKPTKQSFKVSTIEFLVKCNYHDDMLDFWGRQHYSSHSEYRFNFNREYFFAIKGMYFYNDFKNMKLSLNNDDLERDTLVKDYNNGIIDKKTFYRGMMDSFLLDDIKLIIKDNRINYFSKNLKFQIVFSDQKHELFKAFSNIELQYYSIRLNEKEELEMVEILLELLKENTKISSDKIGNEIINIYEEYVLIGKQTYMFDSLKEYDDYADYIFDYLFVVE